MNQTEIHGLSQWEKPDRILMEDFNADNVKTEEALAAVAEQAALISKCGNCKIVYGSYAGNGKNGSSNPNTLSFALKPIYVVVTPSWKGSNTQATCLHLVRGSTHCVGSPGFSDHTNTVSWGEKSVSWYGSSANSQLNTSGTTYHYFALLDTNA